jgi:hypothetical protein
VSVSPVAVPVDPSTTAYGLVLAPRK